MSATRRARSSTRRSGGPSPRQLLELGTYCGYSALRAARVMPEGARLGVGIEFNADNAVIARRIWDHAGIGEELTVLVGMLGDGGSTIARLEAGVRLRQRIAGFRLHGPRQSLPYPNSILGGSWTRAGCIPARWSSPTTSGSLECPITGGSCRQRRAGAGGRASTRPMSSTSRCSGTWCSSRSTWERLERQEPVPGVRLWSSWCASEHDGLWSSPRSSPTKSTSITLSGRSSGSSTQSRQPRPVANRGADQSIDRGPSNVGVQELGDKRVEQNRRAPPSAPIRRSCPSRGRPGCRPPGRSGSRRG